MHFGRYVVFTGRYLMGIGQIEKKIIRENVTNRKKQDLKVK